MENERMIEIWSAAHRAASILSSGVSWDIKQDCVSDVTAELAERGTEGVLNLSAYVMGCMKNRLRRAAAEQRNEMFRSVKIEKSRQKNREEARESAERRGKATRELASLAVAAGVDKSELAKALAIASRRGSKLASELNVSLSAVSQAAKKTVDKIRVSANKVQAS